MGGTLATQPREGKSSLWPHSRTTAGAERAHQARIRMRFSRRSRAASDAFTLVEALIALVVLMIFAVSSTVTLNLFNDRAARTRNAEAARALVENYVSALLASSAVPSATTGTTTLNGMAVDLVASVGGIVIPQPTSAVPQPIPLIVGRNTLASSVVGGTLYWRVQNVGTAYGLNSATDLVQVDLVLQYVYRNVPYIYTVTTFKAAS